MANASKPPEPADPFQLGRFVRAQSSCYEEVLRELKSGRKRTHWMWFVFPQLAGLGFSSTAQTYAIRSIPEAQAYLEHPILGARLHECAEAVLAVQGRTASEIFGSPDDLKLRSCATLFASVSQAGSVFDRILGNYYAGQRDDRTLALLENLKAEPG